MKHKAFINKRRARTFKLHDEHFEQFYESYADGDNEVESETEQHESIAPDSERFHNFIEEHDEIKYKLEVNTGKVME